MTIPVGIPGVTSGDVIVHVFGRTDVGRTREHNEDAFIVADLSHENVSLQPEVRTHTVGPKGTLFMVADGLGGAAAGEIASEIAVTTVYEELREKWVRVDHAAGPEAFAASLKAAAEAANVRIFTYALEHPENRGLGTTATIAGLLGDTLYVAQVGDSRAYLIRDGVARQITKDQSLMQRLVEAGELTQDEAERSERRNIILQALGPEPTVKIDLTYQTLRRGDTLILCTDGLSGLVKKDEIAEVVSSTDDLMEVCRELIDRANEYGGPDNITVVAARFEGHGLADAVPDDPVGHAVYPLSPNPTAPSAREETAIQTMPTPAHGAPAVESAPPPAVPAPFVTPRPFPRGWLIAVLAVILVLAALLASHEWRAAATHAGTATPDTSGEMKPTP